MSGQSPMPLDEPPFLSVGTEVSAKYKGAFCEAKIRKISKIVKCKVQYLNGTIALVSDDAVKGPLKVGATVEVKCNDKKEFVEATIQKIQDCSQYTVVFDDGDITSLKRTALCLKSKKHFAASATLDQLPLTHPEHIGITPIRNIHGRRSQKHKKSLCESGDEDIEELVEKDMGKVICAEYHDKKKIKNNWFPGLIVSPKAQTAIKINVKKEYVVRSFKDGKYFTVLKSEVVTPFTKEIGAKVENPTLKTAVEKALLYLDKDELPPHWDRELLFCGQKNCTATDSEGMLCSDNSDEESIEEKDHFVAQLFKYMDDRGTPINQIPVINGQDVDLYKLFKVVFNCGGFNKVSKSKQWKTVAQKMGYEQYIFSVKQSYQQYLHGFEDFYRKLGCTMLSHPRGVRSRSRFSRSIIRDIDKAQPGTSYTTTDKNKSSSSVKQETNEKKDKTDNDVFSDPLTVIKTPKITEAEEKLYSYKSNDKKKDDSNNSASRNKSSVKWEPDILETKDSSKDSKIKKEMLIKEENDEMEVDDVNNEKKKYSRNLFGKSMRKTTKKEKNIKLKTADVGLSGIRKKRSIKEHIKKFVQVMTPFKKSKRGTSNKETQQESVNKTKPEEDIPKLTRSKSKEELPSKLRRMSVLIDNTESSVIIQPTPSGLNVENQNKPKKSEDEKKKKITRKKKDEKNENKVALNDVILTPVSHEIDTPVKDSQIVYGTDLVVYYGDKHTTTYDAKVLNILYEDGKTKYLVHYKGWNSRYDEWIDCTRIALICPEPEPELDNDADSSKSEQKNADLKKLTRRSVTPSTSYPHRKKSPINSARPTRTCTLNDRPLSSIGKYTLQDNSDSESEYSGNLGLAKQYNKKNQQALKNIKSENDIVSKTDIDTDNQKKIYPKTYPSKEVLLQRSVPKKPKSCVFKVHSTKSEEIDICEQVTLKSPFDFSFEMSPHSDSKTSDLNNENAETPKESENVNDVQNEPKIVPIHYLSPSEKSEINDPQQSISETLSYCDEKIEINKESAIFPSKKTDIVYYQSTSEEDDDDIKLIITKIENENISLPLDDKLDKSKISGTDFDLNKIRSEMKGLMPTSTNNTDLILNTESSIMLDHEGKTENPKTIEPVTEDVYEFKDSEPCHFETIPSVIEEKHRRIIKHVDSPKSCISEKSIELPHVIESIAQDEQNESLDPPKLNSNSPHLFDDIIQKDIKEASYQEHSVITNKIENSISHIQLDNESNISKNVIISGVINNPIHINKIDENQICQIEVDESEKNEVLDLCMKPPESPPNNIFSMPNSNEATNNMVVEDEEYEDDDESKLVIAENDKIDNEFQMDTNLVVCVEEPNSFNGKNEDIQIQSLPPLPPSIHQLPNSGCEFQSSYEIKRDIDIPKESDDESTTSCSESIQNDLIHNYQMYSHFENESMKTKSYQSYIDNDDSTKSGFEFDSCSKSPTTENTENVQSAIQFSIHESMNKSQEYSYERKKDSTKILPELQCREEIVDEETLNNALVIEYNRTNLEYDIHKHNANKGFFDSIHQPSSSKDSFYETDNSNDTKNSFFEARQANLFKSVIFDGNAPSTSRSDIFDDNNPSSITSKNNFYENPVPTTSNNSYSPESDVNNVLFCEETIPGSPTGTLDDQFDQEEKKNMAQTLDEEREAASAMYAMNRSFRRPMITLMGATEEEMEKYTNIIQNDGILDQRHLQFLAEISSRNLGLNINEPSVTEPSSELDSKPIVEQVSKSPEKPQAKRKNSNYEHPTSKRTKISATTSPVADDNIEKVFDVKIPIPLKDGKPLITFTSDMDTGQRQSLILSRINDLRKEYVLVKARIAVIDRRRKKIRKRKREMAKVFTINPK